MYSISTALDLLAMEFRVSYHVYYLFNIYFVREVTLAQKV